MWRWWNAYIHYLDCCNGFTKVYIYENVLSCSLSVCEVYRISIIFTKAFKKCLSTIIYIYLFENKPDLFSGFREFQQITK